MRTNDLPVHPHGIVSSGVTAIVIDPERIRRVDRFDRLIGCRARVEQIAEDFAELLDFIVDEEGEGHRYFLKPQQQKALRR
jgi:hypothetical protein